MEAVIVGGGTAGCMIASFLAQSGVNTTVLEKGTIPTDLSLTYNGMLNKAELKKYPFSHSLMVTLGEGLGGCSSVNGSVWLRSSNCKWIKGLNMQNQMEEHWEKLEGIFPIKQIVGDSLQPFLESLSRILKVPILNTTSTHVQEGIYPLPIASFENYRASSYTTFLKDRHYEKLTIKTEVTVQKIKWIWEEGLIKAQGLYTSHGFIPVNQNLILSAGAYLTPHILMRSGLHNHVTGIGHNLRDHTCLQFFTPCNVQKPSLFVAFFRSSPQLQQPDFQLQFGLATPNENHGFVLQIAYLCSTSSGVVNPTDNDEFPSGSFEMLNESDRLAWMRTFALLQQLFEEFPNLCQGWKMQFENISSYSHPVGTCQLGKVVDSQSFLLHNTQNIYVCDGSVIPEPTIGNPQSFIYALANCFVSNFQQVNINNENKSLDLC